MLDKGERGAQSKRNLFVSNTVAGRKAKRSPSHSPPPAMSNGKTSPKSNRPFKRRAKAPSKWGGETAGRMSEMDLALLANPKSKIAEQMGHPEISIENESILGKTNEKGKGGSRSPQQVVSPVPKDDSNEAA